MKTWNSLTLAVAVLALAATGLLWHETRALRAELTVAQAEEVELGHLMLDFQIRLEKLHEAGVANNWRLAEFYLDELEESAASLYGLNVMEEGSNISDLMESLLPPEVERVKEAVASGDPARFAPAFRRLTSVCNACHRSTGHAFVVIGEPTAPLLSSQRYAIQPAAGEMDGDYGDPRVTSVQ